MSSPVSSSQSASREELGKMNRGFVAALNAKDAQSSGNLGYEIGTFVLTANGPDGKPMIDRGRFVELLRNDSPRS
jgi:ketosteroid isomerase-like protein